MSIILILIAFFIDYKSNKTTFVKDLLGGFLILIALIISSIGFVTLFNLTLVHGVFYFGVEIMLLFSIKALIQSRKQK